MTAVVSIGPILAGIFLIFLWVMVEQLYTQLKQVIATIQREDNIKRQNSSSIHVNKHKSSSLMSTRSWRPMGYKRHHHRQKEPSRKSRSLEHILDSSSNSSNSTYQSEIISRKLEGLTTLPRLRRCQDNPHTFRAYIDCDSYYGNTGTIRSCRSIASVILKLASDTTRSESQSPT